MPRRKKKDYTKTFIAIASAIAIALIEQFGENRGSGKLVDELRRTEYVILRRIDEIPIGNDDLCGRERE